jgi:hypothetical protein
MIWIRVFPTMKDMNIILSYFADEAKNRALKTPHLVAAPEFDAEAVEPAEDAIAEEEASEETASEKAAKPVDPEKLLLQQFSRFLQILSDRAPHNDHHS